MSTSTSKVGPRDFSDSFSSAGQGPPPISQIPDEMLLHIFSFLPPSMEQGIREVSHRWHDAAHDEKHMKEISQRRGFHGKEKTQTWSERVRYGLDLEQSFMQRSLRPFYRCRSDKKEGEKNPSPPQDILSTPLEHQSHQQLLSLCNAHFEVAIGDSILITERFSGQKQAIETHLSIVSAALSDNVLFILDCKNIYTINLREKTYSSAPLLPLSNYDLSPDKVGIEIEGDTLYILIENEADEIKIGIRFTGSKERKVAPIQHNWSSGTFYYLNHPSTESDSWHPTSASDEFLPGEESGETDSAASSENEGREYSVLPLEVQEEDDVQSSSTFVPKEPASSPAGSKFKAFISDLGRFFFETSRGAAPIPPSGRNPSQYQRTAYSRLW